MADLSLRRNQHCIIGLPSCEYVFNSSRSCFIGYGFKTSPMEVDILKSILRDRKIEAVEAGSLLEPGSLAFCTKICSKIITSQFCAIILNYDSVDGKLIPNANVNMEYGMMLGFNKYLLPFQNKNHQLPFNVQGLDTIKYEPADFSRLATSAIDQAILATSHRQVERIPADQMIRLFLINKDINIVEITDNGEKMIYSVISAIGFNLCTSLVNGNYIFLGNFTNLRSEIIKARLRKTIVVVNWMISNVESRIEMGLVKVDRPDLFRSILSSTEIMILVAGSQQKIELEKYLEASKFSLNTNVYTLDEVDTELRESSLF